MLKTRGLTHIALNVRDAERALRFYQELLGVVVVYREVYHIHMGVIIKKERLP